MAYLCLTSTTVQSLHGLTKTGKRSIRFPTSITTYYSP
uniref:Uncharacterized protein n=1 Tax=Rhizophora mucronata TaxID=61149 RepID=A0A2P2PLL8_RHIMU